MVLPAFFSKSSPKKKSDSDSKSNHKPPDLEPRSPTRKSSSRSPTKSSTRERQPRSVRKNSTTRNSSRQIFAADTHPLNLPPDERERRRSAMEAPGEALPAMDVDYDSRAPSVPSSPPPMSPGIYQDLGRDEDRNGDSSPIPPPHGINTTSSPSPAPKTPFPAPPPVQPLQPQLPTIDAEACKTLGNKYFIAKDYKKAVKEYTRGGCLCHS